MWAQTPANHAIFKLQSGVCQFYREYFLNMDFVEIHTPKITPGVSEGGAAVFRLGYFGSECCEARSPSFGTWGPGTRRRERCCHQHS